MQRQTDMQPEEVQPRELIIQFIKKVDGQLMISEAPSTVREYAAFAKNDAAA